MKPIGKDHEIIGLIKKHKKQNINDGLLIVDGLGVLDMYLLRARDGHFPLKALLVCEDLLTETYGKELTKSLIPLANDVYAVSLKTFEQLADKKNSGGLIAVIEWQTPNIEAILNQNKCNIMVLDGLENPGNVGTILRTADAAGIDLVIAVDIKTNIFGAKCIAASRGMIFHVPLLHMGFETAKDMLGKHGYTIYLSEPKEGIPYNEITYDEKSAIVVGAERFGINPKWFDEPHHNIYIPMTGQMTSLNVGVAASVIMFEIMRQSSKF